MKIYIKYLSINIPKEEIFQSSQLERWEALTNGSTRKVG